MKYLYIIPILLVLIILTTPIVNAGDIYYPLKDTLEYYYKSINNRDFESAYSCRTSEYKAVHSYNNFYNMWENNCSIKIVEIWTIESPGLGNGDEAVIGLRVYSTDYDENGNTYSAYYSGKAYMLLPFPRTAPYDWKIDEILLARE